MRSISSLLLPLSVLALFFPSAHAEETPAGQELRELRQAVQQQSKQIELLSAQIARLIRALDGQKNPDSPAPQPSVEIPTAPAEPAPEAPKAEAVPKAEPVVGGPKHTVVKGETLTSIAKRYNIPVAELKKANKIEDERKLQIGQILSVPAAKNPETPEKKENP
jgi:LysM repeat protein